MHKSNHKARLTLGAIILPWGEKKFNNEISTGYNREAAQIEAIDIYYRATFFSFKTPKKAKAPQVESRYSIPEGIEGINLFIQQPIGKSTVGLISEQALPN